MAAVERDTLQAYEEFLAAFPDRPLAKRVRAIIAARREAITWQRTYAVNTPNAYWSYLRRYPHGPHGADARRRLALGAFARQLAGPADRLRLFPRLLLGWLFVVAAKLHLAEDPLALHLLLERLEGLVDVVVSDENLHASFLLDRLQLSGKIDPLAADAPLPNVAASTRIAAESPR